MIRLLTIADKPWLCAGIYAGSAFAIDAVFGEEIAQVALMAGLAFIAAFVYFWILDRLDVGSILWWFIAVIGVPLVFL